MGKGADMCWLVCAAVQQQFGLHITELSEETPQLCFSGCFHWNFKLLIPWNFKLLINTVVVDLNGGSKCLWTSCCLSATLCLRNHCNIYCLGCNISLFSVCPVQWPAQRQHMGTDPCCWNNISNNQSFWTCRMKTPCSICYTTVLVWEIQLDTDSVVRICRLGLWW